MNIYDAELNMKNHRDLAHDAAASYVHTRHFDNGGLRHAYRHTLATLGGVLISLGYRLQGGIEELAAPPELAEPLGLRSNGSGAG